MKIVVVEQNQIIFLGGSLAARISSQGGSFLEAPRAPKAIHWKLSVAVVFEFHTNTGIGTSFYTIRLLYKETSPLYVPEAKKQTSERSRPR